MQHSFESVSELKDYVKQHKKTHEKLYRQKLPINKAQAFVASFFKYKDFHALLSELKNKEKEKALWEKKNNEAPFLYRIDYNYGGGDGGSYFFKLSFKIDDFYDLIDFSVKNKIIEESDAKYSFNEDDFIEDKEFFLHEGQYEDYTHLTESDV